MGLFGEICEKIHISQSDTRENVMCSETLLLEDISENELTFKDNISLRESIHKILQSTKYQVFIVAAIVLDTLMVIVELLLDLELSGKDSIIPEVLHCLSLSLLGLFALETLIKIYVDRLEFFNSLGDMFDALVVSVALILDAISLNSKGAFAGSGLIIVLRLWRVVRIQNRMVMSVHKRGEKKLLEERELRNVMENELEVIRGNYRRVKECCRELLHLIHTHDINIPSTLTLPELDMLL